jgi:hypothetical protein
MSLSPQILQQVQDSIVQSPILVVPYRPVLPDTNTNSAKETKKVKKETPVKTTIPKNEKESLLKNKTETVSVATKDTSVLILNNDSIALQSQTDSTDISVVIDSIVDDQAIIKKDTIIPISYRTSIFNSHELQTDYAEIKERDKSYSDWSLGIIFLITVLLLLNKVLNQRKWSQQMKILFSGRAYEQQLRDEKDFRSPFLFIQFIAASLTISLFLYQLINSRSIFFTEDSGQFLYIKILSAIIALLIIYFVSQKISGFIVDKKKLVSEYLLSTLLLFNITGTLLFPLCIGIEYAHTIPGNIIINIGLIYLGFAFLFKLYKGLTIASSHNSLHLFYLFLYICTLEILPIAITVKFLSENL